MKVKCIGALENLAYYQESIEANKVFSRKFFFSTKTLIATQFEFNKAISKYFLNLATTPPSTALPSEVIFQAATSIIDVFSDETMSYDVNFREGSYLPKLAGPGIDSLRKAIKAVDRKREGGKELRTRGEETLENMRDFVKYRKKLKF